MFSNAIVRKPSRSMINGLTEANLGVPDYELACRQHADYVAALQDCGLRVTELPALEQFPDACVIEDVALLTPRCAILTNPGAETRRGEVDNIADTVQRFFPDAEHIRLPGLLEAGDVMMTGNHYYIGLSARTNQQGAGQLIAILESHGLSGSVVSMQDMLHLKTGLSYLEQNVLLACGEFIGKAEFEKFNIIEIAPEDAYSANCIWVNGTVLVPQGYSRTSGKIVAAGYPVRELEMSEFQKLDGGLSCLSLRF